MISLPAIEAVLEQHYPSEGDQGPVIAVEATPHEDHPELVLFTTLDVDRQTINQEIRQAGGEGGRCRPRLVYYLFV